MKEKKKRTVSVDFFCETIKIICSWCGRSQGQKPTRRADLDGKISHTICEDCKRKLLKQKENK